MASGIVNNDSKHSEESIDDYADEESGSDVIENAEGTQSREGTPESFHAKDTWPDRAGPSRYMRVTPDKDEVPAYYARYDVSILPTRRASYE